MNGKFSEDPNDPNYVPTIFDPSPVSQDIKIEPTEITEHNYEEMNPNASDEKMETNIDDWTGNPWAVGHTKEFLMYNCPECEFKDKEEIKLLSHGLQNHSKAKEYFEKNPTITNEQDKLIKVTQIQMESRWILILMIGQIIHGQLVIPKSF